MTGYRVVIHSAFMLLLPMLVACYGLSPFTTLLLLLLALLWRWAIVVSGILMPAPVPDLQLETISASHFAEKVRWCMDRLGVEYTEHPTAGTLGVFFTGRTVPQLKIRTGATRSVIGDSPDILRYLWGRYANSERADFLRASTERLAMEQRIDRYGVDLQVWVYYHMLDHRELTLHAWGADSPLIPLWQRKILQLLFPLLRTLIRKVFNISDRHYQKAVEHIETRMDEFEQLLADGRASLSGDAEINYVDICAAAISGLWLQPANYGGGQAESVRITESEMPTAMSNDIARWRAAYPVTVSWMENLYREQRH